ncbi:hypothetical protein CcI156_18330 [Frankia sp. CcI156]|jgi:hypothetical protein|uniref:hypothetical protein n=1 Tax=unclassified Frankia TaxID=2632575 RepID=UPI0002F08A21|nr:MULTISPECIES: hypothetical protein [unclassified Frankia]EYT91195.1 hypothetical protein ThrDRAFT_03122 [Frankia casuarinae]ONH23503.1 hypothetical protein CcI156_18330 [Frankia sp. CcI156]ETA00017.1 hypothetical protein CcI6DRAFT_04555 [Frankia sp. CcI6]KFB03277.1 hypothetical protein ALLO2DRAFT_03959 [Frankia sp. Allo2]OAA18660.1 hypothetical protein AAY23_111916 [Frankia casuarinae]
MSAVRIVIEMLSVRRVESARRLTQVLTILDRPAYRGQALAVGLRDQIRDGGAVPAYGSKSLGRRL